jgi:tetratricopeptide (TPR) repeat protein
MQLAAGGTNVSVGLAEESIQAEPTNAEARLVLVRGLLARKDLPRAESELKGLSARFPGSAAVHVQMGILQALKDDPTGARKHFDRALELEPGSTEAFGGLVALDLAAKRFSDARARVDGRLAQDGTNTSILMIAARVYASVGDAKGAEEILRRVIELEPALLGAYATLAQLYVTQGRLDAALVEFDQLARRDQRPVTALTLAGIVLQAQGKTSAALERFERALQVDPTAAVAANNLAWIYAESGANLDVALQLARTAYSKLPETPQVGDTLGFIYYKKDLLPQAIQTLKPVVEQDPANATYHYHLGLAYAKAGDIEGAREHLTRAVGLKADFDGATEAKALISSLGGR